MQFGYDLAGSLTYSSDAVTGAIGNARSPAGEISSLVNHNYSDQYNPSYLVSKVVNGQFSSISYSFGNGLSLSV